MTLTFAQEQQVQYCIAILQKQTHVPIWEINESFIRQCVSRGQKPTQIVIEIFRPTKES